MSAKRNDEHTHKCDDWTEEYLVWKQEMVVKPEVIYVSYLFILDRAWLPSERESDQYFLLVELTHNQLWLVDVLILAQSELK